MFLAGLESDRLQYIFFILERIDGKKKQFCHVIINKQKIFQNVDLTFKFVNYMSQMFTYVIMYLLTCTILCIDRASNTQPTTEHLMPPQTSTQPLDADSL